MSSLGTTRTLIEVIMGPKPSIIKRRKRIYPTAANLLLACFGKRGGNREPWTPHRETSYRQWQEARIEPRVSRMLVLCSKYAICCDTIPLITSYMLRIGFSKKTFGIQLCIDNGWNVTVYLVGKDIQCGWDINSIRQPGGMADKIKVRSPHRSIALEFMCWLHMSEKLCILVMLSYMHFEFW